MKRPLWMTQVPVLSGGMGLSIGAHNALAAAILAMAAMFCFDQSFKER